MHHKLWYSLEDMRKYVRTVLEYNGIDISDCELNMYSKKELKQIYYRYGVTRSKTINKRTSSLYYSRY